MKYFDAVEPNFFLVIGQRGFNAVFRRYIVPGGQRVARVKTNSNTILSIDE
jgi:hypothetical protein